MPHWLIVTIITFLIIGVILSWATYHLPWIILGGILGWFLREGVHRLAVGNP